MSSDLQNATRLPLAEPSPAEHNPARQAFLSVFGPYLAHAITVHSPALGRGLLVGLPYSTRWERAFADVRFENLPAGWDTYDLSAIKPVLYAAEDFSEVKGIALQSGDYKSMAHLMGFDRAALEAAAVAVDAARALGIALNLPEGSYVRKEVARAH